MHHLILLALYALVGVTALIHLIRYHVRMAKLNAIPTIGRTSILPSYISAYKFIKNANAIIKEGYLRYPNSAFKVPLPDRWLVVISGPDMIDDVRKATDEQLSSRLALKATFHTDLVFGKSFNDNNYHFEVIATTFTRSIGLKAPDIYDEMVAAFTDELAPTNDWVKVPTLPKVLNIVSRTSNRVFVGLPLCRNEEWKSLSVEFMRLAFNTSQTINVFPTFLQPIVGWYLNPHPAAFPRASKLLRPVILERLGEMAAHAHSKDWVPSDDLLTWLIRAAHARNQQPDPDDLINMIMSTNMAAIHTTSLAFTHALFNLALRPELVQLLRGEVEPIIQEEGWTKTAMGRMKMLDSFMKESQRVSSSSPVSVSRMTLQDFTFSNGIVVPTGTLIATSVQATHFDDKNYPNATEFDALRSYRKQEKEDSSYKHQMVTPEVSYLSFGAGKHACPGRFFAVNELKFFLSHILLHYDIKFDERDKRPTPNIFGARVNLDARTQIMIRKRAQCEDDYACQQLF